MTLLILITGTDSTSQSNTVELYGTHDGNFNDDAKSYSTYEKGLDEDYAKHYEDESLDGIKPQKHSYMSEETVARTSPPANPWPSVESRSMFVSHVTMLISVSYGSTCRRF